MMIVLENQLQVLGLLHTTTNERTCMHHGLNPETKQCAHPQFTLVIIFF